MSFTSQLDDGMNMPSNKTLRHKLSAYIGYKRATRRKNVFIEKPSLISPEAMINARTGVIRCGKNTMICPHSIVQGNVTMGENCSVQSFAVIVGYGTETDREGEIIIGNNVRIASHAMIIAADHIFKNPDIPICKQGVDRKTIIIEDDVWVAGKVSITAGVRVGKGSVLAAGAVVTHDVPPYSIVGGVPAKVIKERK